MRFRIFGWVNYTNYLFTTKPDNTDGVVTTVTASGSVVELWLNHISSPGQRLFHHDIVSFDVKHPTDSRVVTVLQLGLAGHCLLFQLSYADYIPESLRAFFANPSFTFVGVGIHREAMRLYHDRDLVVHSMTDLGLLAEVRCGFHPIGLQDLAYWLMDVDWIMPPMVEISDYSKRDLPDDEVIYASMDSIILADLGRRLCLDANYSIRDWIWIFFGIV